jgi:TRAP-type C4-dicarboxylate transport system substrate-binding protein
VTIGRAAVKGFLLLWSSVAAAEPAVLRLASVAPEGSVWANELRAWGRESEQATSGETRVRWYFGAVLGDEQQTLQRIRAGQLDGLASGGMACERVAPSMRIQGLPGVFQSRDEVTYVMDRLRPTIYAEAEREGFAMLVTTGLGPEVIFSRAPVRSFAELKLLRLWRWSVDEVGIAMSREMRLTVVPTELEDARRAYDEGRIDGFLAIPTAALAFQWSAQARYITDLRVGYLTGCVIIAQRAFDRLPAKNQQVIHALMSKYDVRFEDNGRRQDEALLGGLFQRQGLRPVPPNEAFRSEFLNAARSARERKAEQLVSRELLDRVLRMLADFRLEHGH